MNLPKDSVTINQPMIGRNKEVIRKRYVPKIVDNGADRVVNPPSNYHLKENEVLPQLVILFQEGTSGPNVDEAALNQEIGKKAITDAVDNIVLSIEEIHDRGFFIGVNNVPVSEHLVRLVIIGAGDQIASSICQHDRQVLNSAQRSGGSKTHVFDSIESMNSDLSKRASFVGESEDIQTSVDPITPIPDEFPSHVAKDMQIIGKFWGDDVEDETEDNLSENNFQVVLTKS